MHGVQMKESEIMASYDIRMASRWQHNKNLQSVGGTHKSDLVNMIFFDEQISGMIALQADKQKTVGS